MRTDSMLFLLIAATAFGGPSGFLLMLALCAIGMLIAGIREWGIERYESHHDPRSHERYKRTGVYETEF